jgi:hypothetical protein
MIRRSLWDWLAASVWAALVVVMLCAFGGCGQDPGAKAFRIVVGVGAGCAVLLVSFLLAIGIGILFIPGERRK